MTSEVSKPVFHIQTVYLKDLSLEQPHSPAIFLEKQRPEIEVELNVGVERLAETTFESTVVVTVTAKIGDKTAYLVEGKQAGIFEIGGVPEEAMNQILYVTCPTIVYPYLRSNIAETVTKGGFPPIHLAMINFEALYQDRLQRQKEQNAHDGTVVQDTSNLPTQH